jgi:tetratricopeptide (TPR) repeat protein
MTFPPEQIEAHNRFYDEAWALIKGEIFIDGRPLSSPGWFARRRLTKAKRLFEKTISINPAGWNAMFAIGKIEQRFGRRKEAFDWMLKAREFAPDNTSLAKEASAIGSQLGMHEWAARIADEAIALSPKDAALIVNSGLAHICSGNRQVALDRFREAARLEPRDEMNRKLEAYAAKVLIGSLPVPHAESDILRELKHA